MIAESTVLILGAGASHPYGFPLGSTLVANVLTALADEEGLLARAVKTAGHSQRDLRAFRERLHGADTDSIDTFLEGNSEQLVGIGKLAIAFVILSAEAESRWLRSGPRPDDHWLGYLWNAMRSGCTLASLGMNRVRFVTFNYDRLVETYFARVIANTFGCSEAEAIVAQEQDLPVIHLHGAIAKSIAYGWCDGQLMPSALPNCAADIRIIHDAQVAEDVTWQAAHQAMSGATQVIFLGFGYHPTNLQRLSVNRYLPRNARISGSAYRLGNAEQARASKLIAREWHAGGSGEACRDFLQRVLVLR